MPGSNQLYFVDVCLPNEGEPDQALEIVILRWSGLLKFMGGNYSARSGPGERSSRPEVYVHSFLKPLYPNRLRWGSAMEMGFTRELVGTFDNMPVIADMINVDYLKGRRVVCFDDSQEPLRSLCQSAQTVERVSALWQELMAQDEEALTCTRLPQMLEYLNLKSLREEKSPHYTPVMIRCFALAGLWYLLSEAKSHPKHRLKRDDLHLNPVWPLQEEGTQWFEGKPASLRELTRTDIENFFSGSLCDRLDWYRMNMYANDWVFKRPQEQQDGFSRQLEKQSLVADYIFNRALPFKMQLWVLVYYAVYGHKLDYARTIALAGGNFGHIPKNITTNFSSFLVSHLGDFLQPTQKLDFLRSLINQLLHERAQGSFEELDFDQMSKAQRESGNTGYFFKSEMVCHGRLRCFKEIVNSEHEVVYRSYEITGHGQERVECMLKVRELFKDFILEAQNPYSSFWTDSFVHGWIRYTLGVTWQELSRPPRMSEEPRLIEARRALSEIIDKESYTYVRQLHQHLSEDIVAISRNPEREFTDRFCFMGMSVQVTVSDGEHGKLFGKLFSLS